MSTRRYGPYTVETSNEDKRLFGESGPTKGGLVSYYEAVAEPFLRHARGRPLTMERYPDGIDGEGFYQKRIGDYFPDWIRRARVATADGRQIQVICDNRATLVYLANQACLTMHLFASRVGRLRRPDRLILDLDPSGDDFAAVRRAARRCGDLLREIGLVPFVKTTGSRGVHVVVPVRPGEGFDAVRSFAGDVAGLLAARHPEELTTEQRKRKRRGRLYLDVGRNAYGQTAVAPYSVRALPGAPVATPIRWAELDDPGVTARTFDVENVPRRVARGGDPWRGMGRRARSLAAARRQLASLARSAGTA